MSSFRTYTVRVRDQHTKFGLSIGGVSYEWSFTDLFKASSEKEILFLDIESLGVLDTDPWFESIPKQPTLRRLVAEIIRIEKADCSYPCIVVEGIGVIDGAHRIVKTYLQNKSKINCVVFTIPELMKISHTMK